MKSETSVHISARRFLKSNGWILIAGQYPGGSDDELPVMNIVDPLLAKDTSPDHRRHSLGKFVPDIVAIKHGKLLLVEAKAKYSQADKLKLDDLLNNHLDDLEKALYNFQLRHPYVGELLLLKPVPCLAFSHPKAEFPVDERFAYIIADDMDSARWIPDKEL